MSILIFNRSPRDLCPYDKFLKPLKEDLVLLTSDLVASQFQNFGYTHIESFHNYENNGLVEWRAIELFEQYHFRTIIAIAEVDMVRAAKLRERFRLSGQSVSSAINFRDKVIMKETAKKCGILTPPFTRLEHPMDLIRFVRKHGFPIILKPVDGVGSRNTFILNQRKELINLLEKGLPPAYVAEGFIDGDIYHVDGVIIDRQIRFICASKYINKPIHYNEKGYLGSYILDPHNPLSQRLIQLTETILQNFQTPPTTTFHAEWFHTPDDKLIFCEIASRTGGGKIIQSVRHAYGVDLFQAFVEPQCNLPYLPFPKTNTSYQMAGWVKIPPKQGIFQSAPTTNPPEWVIEYDLLGEQGKHYHQPNGIGQYIAAFVVKGNSEKDVHQKLLKTVEWFQESSKWVIF